MMDATKKVDMLLGVAEFTTILLEGVIKGPLTAPTAHNSEFGWLIMGPAEIQTPSETIQIKSLISNIELHDKIKTFFTAEGINDETNESSDDEENEKLTDEEKYCEQHFVQTIRRDDTGRFVATMPFRNGEPSLGNSKKAALATLFQLEKKFQRQHELKNLYTEAIRDAINQGHMEFVETVPVNAHFIPHHAVFKDSTTTKLRTVYNASQKTSNGLTLNEQLAVGKIEQPEIFALMLNWRKHKIAIIGDLEKMYKQIKLNENQQHLQMILWRENSNEPIKAYKLTTVTFGLANSPFIAIRTVKELGKIVEKEFPLASKAIRDCFYVDDYTGGADTTEEAVAIYRELKVAFQSAGFNIRKFVSNSEEFLNLLPENDKEQICDDAVKTLGVVWRPSVDDLSLQFRLKQHTTPNTKRKLLSEIAALYDPMGWAAPVVIKAKILMQKVWKSGVQWDENVSSNFIKDWMKFKGELNEMSTLSIPRYISGLNNVNQVHGFCDASEDAYSAGVYVKNSNGMYLLTAKTRVTPNKKQLTIPKLELCAATLLAKLMKKIVTTMNLTCEIFLWSDSTIVIAWLNENPKKWKVFVSARVAKIKKIEKQISEKNNCKITWFHISGKVNPADCASRGIWPSELITHKLWWNGPDEIDNLLEVAKQSTKKYETTIEMNTKKIALIASETNENILPHASSWYKLQRVMVYVRRFVDKCSKRKAGTDKITTSEIDTATTTIIRLTQKHYFKDEIASLQLNGKVKNSSNIKQLCVFLDENELIRVGGRLKNADIPFDQKHQILLPNVSPVTELIIENVHKNNLHAGPRATEAAIRQKFWIIASQTTIKRVLHKCVKCARFKGRTMKQLMADLPSERVNAPFKPFLKTAVDFAGPINIKTSTLRAAKIVKAYIAIFVCLATKAMHIEAVSDLTADSFMAALRRFVARRGEITDMYSDNGTNFVKTNRILDELFATEKQQFETTFFNTLCQLKINWHFAPASSPHFNGLAEAAVKTTKYHLKRVIGQTALTFEELSTVLSQIEAVVNSRPLCEMSNDPNEDEVLTPAHFLHHTKAILPPDEDNNETKANYLSRWQTVQRISQNFWKKWKSDYLNQLQVRGKWASEKPNVKIGELVLIKEDNTPPAQWAMGRIVDTHPGKDGNVRVASIKTANNTLKRAIAKLAPLPIVTTLLALLSSIRPASTASALDVIRTAIDSAATMYNSETTRELLRRYTHNKNIADVEGYETLRKDKQFFSSLLQVNDLERHRFKWLMIGITIAVLTIGCICFCCAIMFMGKRRRDPTRANYRYGSNTRQRYSWSASTPPIPKPRLQRKISMPALPGTEIV